MNPKLTLLILGALSVCFAAKRLGIRASVYLLAYFTALNVFAQNKVVNGVAAPPESNQTYAAVSGTAALYVYHPGASYSGTNIVLSATFDTGAGRYGAYANNQASLSLTGGSVTTTGSGGGKHGVYLNNSSSGVLHDVAVATHNGNGVNVLNTSTATISGDTITLTGTSGYGLNVSNTSSAFIERVVIIANNPEHFRGYGIVADNHSTVTGTNLTINTQGPRAYGLHVETGAMATIYATAITTSGSSGIGVMVNTVADGVVSVARLYDVDITTTGEGAYGLSGGYSPHNGNAVIYATNVRVNTYGADAAAIYLDSSPDRLTVLEIDGGAYAAADGAGLEISNRISDSVNEYQVTIKGGAEITGTAALVVKETAAPTGQQTLVTISVEEASKLIGGADFKGSTNTTLNLDNSSLTGNVSGNDNAVVAITVSGTGSTIISDITQNDHAAVTVILDDGATGSGGYNGGNLITGKDSAWTFDKNSHGSYGENHGTWNLGDYDITFDNLTHTGTINISVNSDTGDGGTITVTNTADGDGTVHINTTGNGKLNPNDVLPGIVSGDGTENWQWDPIDWGIDTIIKDGDHFIKQGTSPAGAVLNSSVAIQQAMWFAQQNSLLKRMGELRYGTRASRPPAGGTPALHNLIENIWLRSYGQQLNIGSQVAGKAYEQLIYGVDLGTDHKFTISADSDLYLGVYAGYGRSDIDYRTPGTDGEINSYYGGLYATWLHSSGFYIDATFKAASVDNNLKAPYGSTQLTASYSDVNIGGSIEIGNKFTFTDAWFIEPQLQVNYLHILAEDYTAGPMTIGAQDLDALQLRLGSVFGRTIKLTNSGALQPYVKISGVETISSGGTIRNGYQHTRANTDGARAELGAGLIWQLDAGNQLHLDYEASFGDKYDKPWGLTAGYRHQF
ncbi:MAG: autotransporter outer membrane beta-barrel domain-containing protein [Verrucomicrobiales bacterium]|jgi:outer membrane autotransporter protein|nr:autotransporter outer membrane beta-barrel domain-containing protein [Verrucomicrobiales bacterium]